MKPVGIPLTVVALLLLGSTTEVAKSESVLEKTGIDGMLGVAPSAVDVLSEINQFDLFEQGADESAQQRGDDALKQFSSEHAEAAEKQDKQLAALAKKAGVNVELSKEPAGNASNRLAGLQGSVGSDFIRQYYGAQVSEYEQVLSLLRRYLEKPDNDEIRSFATKQISSLEASQKVALATSKQINP
jgi:putative membrane protein